MVENHYLKKKKKKGMGVTKNEHSMKVGDVANLQESIL